MYWATQSGCSARGDTMLYRLVKGIGQQLCLPVHLHAPSTGPARQSEEAAQALVGLWRGKAGSCQKTHRLSMECQADSKLSQRCSTAGLSQALQSMHCTTQVAADGLVHAMVPVSALCVSLFVCDCVLMHVLGGRMRMSASGWPPPLPRATAARGTCSSS